MNEKTRRYGNGLKKARILIVADHPVVLEGLTQLINREDDLAVCAEADNVEQALKALEKQELDLAVVDILLENTTGIQVANSLNSRYPSLRVLILSMSDDPHYVRSAFQAGARGYVTKDEVSEKIVAAIRRVLRGEIYVSKKLTQKFSRRTVVNWTLAAGAQSTQGSA
ncbi:MAG: response regulator [Planctomycetota bacterium]|jgi:DNA-binding NarL/FixJ family response regulator